jgi:hypothetical protein
MKALKEDVQIMRMHYGTGRFRSDRETKVLTKNCPLYITRAYHANGPGFHGLNEILHDERYE